MGNARRENWIMARLRRETHARLLKLAILWQTNAENGRPSPYSPDRATLSLDQVVTELLDRDDAHRARSRKSIARTRDTAGPATADGG